MANSEALNKIYDIRGALTPAWNLPSMVLSTLDQLHCDKRLKKIIAEEASRTIANQSKILECLREVEDKLIKLGEET